jgi:hypothetical protein
VLFGKENLHGLIYITVTENVQLVRLGLSAESAAIQQCFSLTANQRTVLSATINQRNEHAGILSKLKECILSDESDTFYCKTSPRRHFLVSHYWINGLETTNKSRSHHHHIASGRRRH